MYINIYINTVQVKIKTIKLNIKCSMPNLHVLGLQVKYIKAVRRSKLCTCGFHLIVIVKFICIGDLLYYKDKDINSFNCDSTTLFCQMMLGEVVFIENEHQFFLNSCLFKYWTMCKN